MRSFTLTAILLTLLTFTYGQPLTTYYFPNYYCNQSICPSGGPHVACNSPYPFGYSCNGKQPQLVSMSTDLQAQILDQHNRQRSLLASGQLPGYPPAAKMPTLQWDLELQYLAEANARSCEYGHDKCRNTYWSKYVGQNIAIIRHFGLQISKPEAIKYFIDAWFNEYVYARAYVDSYPQYYYGPQIGHFTQIISDRTVKIGCGMVTYKTYNGDVWTNDYFVCNYSFTNIIGQPTYIKGAPGSQCVSGVSAVYPGLCN
ncbi:antigen 5 like allergen Cul n 1-like isoform X2 [Topomyia yanbarensis]|uniref:antigen 5 like allergen Cul n 1-like isoform X2 n=1 Tax=Topomyia yanbarensis TaxID=2498891 RepID=UPI00273B91BF|nr:antigen 5 like allergen Cul n 1-like isoform X2 [Topomyia yanbarensis]